MGTLLLVAGTLLFFIGAAQALLAAMKIRPQYGLKKPLIKVAIAIALLFVGAWISPPNEPTSVPGARP